MGSKESLLGALIAEELQRVNEKTHITRVFFNVPAEKLWKSGNALTLEKFLEQNPLPKDKNDLPLYGIAWQCVFGMKTPDEINEAKDFVIVKSKCGLDMTDLEKIWLKLMAADPDMF